MSTFGGPERKFVLAQQDRQLDLYSQGEDLKLSLLSNYESY